MDVKGAVEEWRAPRFQSPVNLFQLAVSPGHGSISADGDLLAVAVAGAGVELWRLSEKRRIPLSLEGIGEVFLPVFNESGDLYLIQFDHRIVRLKAGAWTQEGSWQWDRSSMTGGFARNGQWNIQTHPGQGNEVHIQLTLRNLETGAVETHRTGPGTYSSSFCAGFSWDGRMVGVPAEPGLVVVHTVPEMKEVRRFGGHRHGAKSVGFSPDGSRVATGSLGRETIKLWDWESGLELLTLGTDNRGVIQHIYFSSDGNLILLHSGNDSAYLWRAPSWEEINAAEAQQRAEAGAP
jgi:WD40 repeat protein